MYRQGTIRTIRHVPVDNELERSLKDKLRAVYLLIFCVSVFYCALGYTLLILKVARGVDYPIFDYLVNGFVVLVSSISFGAGIYSAAGMEKYYHKEHYYTINDFYNDLL